MNATKFILIYLVALGLSTGCQSNKPSASVQGSQPTFVYGEGAYAFDAEFLTFFGTNGVANIQEAFSKMRPPVQARRSVWPTASPYSPPLNYDLIDTGPQPQLHIEEVSK